MVKYLESNKISRKLRESLLRGMAEKAIKEDDEIEIAIKVNRLDKDVLDKISKHANILDIVKLTKHIHAKTKVKKLRDLIDDDDIALLDEVTEMRALEG